MPAPEVTSAAYKHEAQLWYATPEQGYHDTHYITLEEDDPGEVNAQVHGGIARSRLAFFHITRAAIISVNHGDTSDILNMQNVTYGARQEQVTGKRLMRAAHLVVGETDGVFDLKTEADILAEGQVPERVRAWLDTWRHGSMFSNVFPKIQALL